MSDQAHVESTQDQPASVDQPQAEQVNAQRVESPAAPAPDYTSFAMHNLECQLMQLTAQQRYAMEKISSGHSMIQAALAAGVHRTTLYRWLREDPDFQAAFNTWQLDAMTTARGRLIALTHSAVTTLGNSIASGNTHASLTLLKSLGLLKTFKPGQTDPETLQTQAELEATRQRNRLEQDKLHASMGWAPPKDE